MDELILNELYENTLEGGIYKYIGINNRFDCPSFECIETGKLFICGWGFNHMELYKENN
jgi:hypothetical protein